MCLTPSCSFQLQPSHSPLGLGHRILVNIASGYQLGVFLGNADFHLKKNLQWGLVTKMGSVPQTTGVEGSCKSLPLSCFSWIILPTVSQCWTVKYKEIVMICRKWLNYCYKAVAKQNMYCTIYWTTKSFSNVLW